MSSLQKESHNLFPVEVKKSNIVAQLINDICQPVFSFVSSTDDLSQQIFQCNEIIANYLIRSLECNVIEDEISEDGTKVAFINIKPLSKGDELYYSYCIGYWIDRVFSSDAISLSVAKALTYATAMYDAKREQIFTAYSEIQAHEIKDVSPLEMELYANELIAEYIVVKQNIDKFISLTPTITIEDIECCRKNGGFMRFKSSQK
jgi:hypothetical protein